MSFWEKLSECLNEFHSRDILLVCGDLNARVSVVKVKGVTGRPGGLVHKE